MSDTDFAPSEAPPPAASAASPRRWHRHLAWGLGGLLLTLIVLVTSGIGWLWRSESGTQWLLTQVPGLKLTHWRGALGGERLSAEQLTLTLTSGELVLDDVSLEGLRWTWRPDPQAWAGVAMQQLSARKVRWQSHAHSASSTTPSGPPADLRLPVQLAVAQLSVAEVQVDQWPALRHLQGQLHLGAQHGGQHQVSIAQVETDRFQLSGAASLLTTGPMTLQSQLSLHSQPGTGLAWQATLAARGPLSDLAAQAQLQGQAAAGQSVPSVQLQTQLQPFAHWPIGQLNLKTDNLDLSALFSEAPRTALRGSARVRSSGLDQPAHAELSLHNDLPGRWDEHRLPVREMSLRVAGPPQPLRELTLKELVVEFANAQGSAGRWAGEGRYLVDPAQPHTARAELSLKLQQWQPGALDKRAPALLLSGPVDLALAPVPSPTAEAASDSALPPPVLSVLAKLTGQLQSRSAPGQGRGDPSPSVSLGLAAQLSERDAVIQQLDLRADTASASVKGRIQQIDTRLRWQLAAQVQALDLRTWWPGDAGSAWQRGQQQLNASLDTEASLPWAALKGAHRDPSALWRLLRGQLMLKLTPSTLAGLPVEGHLQLRNDDSTQQADAELMADDARLQASWQDDAGSDGRGSLTLKAPHLSAFAPLAQWQPASAAWAPRGGALDMQWALQEVAGQPGHWRWRAEGSTSGLQAGNLTLDKAQWRGQGEVGDDWPLALQLNGNQLVVGEARASQFNASVTGGLAQHQLQLTVDSPVQPPLWLQQLAGTGPKPGARLQVQLTGGYVDRGDQGADWSGRWRQILLRGSQPNGQDWLSAKNLAAQLHWDGEGRLTQAELAPGELVMLSSVLAWQAARFSQMSADRPALLTLQAKLSDTPIAPLLQRMQPDAVWSGDLQVGGQVQLRYDGRLSLDAVLERRSGDLTLDEDGLLATTRQLPLGLTDLRLGLRVQDGAWQFTQALAGQSLGSLGAALTVHAAPEQLWPPTGSPIQGTAMLQIQKLGAWAPWTPPGWRLGGELASAVKIGGRLGAPEIAGELTGQRLSVQNPLMGVALTGGQARLLLEGERARLEQLVFKGGDGSISATGTAELGAKPAAKLNLEAKRFRVLGRIDRTLVASGQAQLGLDRDALNLTGQVTVDEGLIDISRGDGPELPEDVVMARSEAEQAAEEDKKANGQSQRATQLNLQLDLGQKLRLRGKGIDTGLQGALKITTPRGKLAMAGTVRTVGGNYAAYGQKLTIERGSILFTGPMDDPRLDIYAIRPNLDVQVGVVITGTALNPRVRLYSDTDMSDTDKLSWLVMGRAPEGLGQADTAMLQRAALALLMGNSGSPTDNLLETIGLSDFSLRQAAGENNVQTTVVSVGKQLTRRWYVGYERGVNATTGTWQLIYRIAQRFTLRAQSGEDSALDAIWTWRW